MKAIQALGPLTGAGLRSRGVGLGGGDAASRDSSGDFEEAV